MTTDTALTPQQRARLSVSLSVLLPRIESITREFCAIVEHAVPVLRLHMPSNEQVVQDGIEQLLVSVGDQDASERLARSLGHLGRDSGIEQTDLPVLLAAIQTAMAEQSGYTWTNALEDDWTQWFDMVTEWVLQGAALAEAHAA